MKFVATPDGRRHSTYQLEDAASLLRVARQQLRTLDRLCNVRDDPVSPAAQLVAEDAEPFRPAAPDGSLSDHATLRAIAARDRRLLDHEASLRYVHDESRVVEVAARASFEASGHRLEDASVQADGVAART